MPKYRIRSAVKGAKSIARRIKHKIGGRKSGKGTNQMSPDEMIFMKQVRKRDRNKLRRALKAQGINLPS